MYLGRETTEEYMMEQFISVSTKSKLFLFDDSFDLLLVHSFSMLEANVVKLREVRINFEGVSAAFCAHHWFIDIQNESDPAHTFTMLLGRITKLVSHRRT